MFCSNCGARIDAAKFCPSCGAAASQTKPAATVSGQPPRKSRFWVWVLGLIVLLLVIRVWNDLNESPSTTTTTSSNSTSADSSQSAATRYGIGQNVVIGYWAYRCDGVRWAKSIGSEYADAEFLIVNLSIRNNDNSASTLPPLQLVDAQGREYDESSKEIFLENAFETLKQVNPGVTSHGSVAFDVAPGDYALRISGGFASGKTALIDLPYSAASRSTAQ